MKTKAIEVVVLIDEDGDYVVAGDDGRDTATAGALAAYAIAFPHAARHGIGRRWVYLTLTVPVPEPIELTADMTGPEPVALVAAKVA